MITLLTNDDCIQFNCVDYQKENQFIHVLKYHKLNKTGKKIKVISNEYSGLIDPKLVNHCQQENRVYDKSVGDKIEDMIKGVS